MISSNNDLKKKMQLYLRESAIALEYFNQSRERFISETELQVALGEKLGYNSQESLNVIDAEMTAEGMIKLLRDFPFSSHKVIYELVLTENILDGIASIILLEKRIKVNGHIWEIHKNDVDPFPSDPHAHSVESSVKLHLGTGDIYIKRNIVGRIKVKELEEIRKKLTAAGITLPN